MKTKDTIQAMRWEAARLACLAVVYPYPGHPMSPLAIRCPDAENPWLQAATHLLETARSLEQHTLRERLAV